MKYIIRIRYRAFDKDFTTRDFLRNSIPDTNAQRIYVKKISGCPTAYLLWIEVDEILETKCIGRREYEKDWLQ